MTIIGKHALKLSNNVTVMQCYTGKYHTFLAICIVYGYKCATCVNTLLAACLLEFVAVAAQAFNVHVIIVTPTY